MSRNGVMKDGWIPAKPGLEGGSFELEKRPELDMSDEPEFPQCQYMI